VDPYAIAIPKEDDHLPDFLDIALPLLRLPTAPFHEHRIVAAIDTLINDWSGPHTPLSIERDAAGNLIIRYEGTNSGSWLYLTGHLDHPGFGFIEHLTRQDLLFERLGGLPVQFCRDAHVQIHSTRDLHSPLSGTITAYLEDTLFEGERRPAFRVNVDESTTAVGPGSFAVWDLPPTETKKRKLRATACDDLAGVAVALTVLANLLKEGARSRVALLLTRAEETGFGGMLDYAASDRLDQEGVFINIECSSCLAGAPLGDGPVIRVGDRRWLFDPQVTAALVTAAADKSLAQLPYQRRLMDGGTCEATVLSRAGVPTAAVALPLANYHNTGRRGVRREAIDLDDAEHLVELLTRVARTGAANLLHSGDSLGEQLTKRHQLQAPRLHQTAPQLPGSDSEERQGQ
jgi:putative aminopeptidase FrvX